MSIIQFTNFKAVKETENALKVLIVENNLRPTAINDILIELVRNEIKYFKENKLSVAHLKEFNKDFQVILKRIIDSRRALEKELAELFR